MGKQTIQSAPYIASSLFLILVGVSCVCVQAILLVGGNTIQIDKIIFALVGIILAGLGIYTLREHSHVLLLWTMGIVGVTAAIAVLLWLSVMRLGASSIWLLPEYWLPLIPAFIAIVLCGWLFADKKK